MLIILLQLTEFVEAEVLKMIAEWRAEHRAKRPSQWQATLHITLNIIVALGLILNVYVLVRYKSMFLHEKRTFLVLRLVNALRLSTAGERRTGARRKKTNEQSSGKIAVIVLLVRWRRRQEFGSKQRAGDVLLGHYVAAIARHL
jgi:hypothetical protein